MQHHLLQSPEWEQYSQLEGHQTFRLSGDDFDTLAILHHTPLGNYLFCPYGPTLDPENPVQSLEHALSSLNQLARDQHAIFIRIEPTASFTPDQLQPLGLVKSHDLEPAHTWILDLTQPRDDLLAGIEKTKVRHWRNHAKKSIRLRTTQDPEQISILTHLLAGVGARDHFTPQDENHLKNQLKSGFATLYIAEIPSDTADHTVFTPIAASLVYDYDDTRHYAHAATDDAYRKLMGGTVLLVQMILDAQDRGTKTFDFWGITTSDDPHHPWYGFTQYKKSFGGHQVDYSGTWDLPINKPKYHLYQALRQANRLKRSHHKPQH